MSTDTLVQRLREHVARAYLKIAPEALATDQPLISSGLIDSFNLVDLALFVEQEFGVRVEDTELNSATFDTLGQLATLIGSRL
jgi:acyl carrier protein